jgi:glycosyltransferase involved in cell wall biosynthesis
LGYPVFECDGLLSFGDVHYEQTIELCTPCLDEFLIVARIRKVKNSSLKCARLEDVNARLGLELPDFGMDGQTTWRNGMQLLFDRKLKSSFLQLVQTANFVYVEAPSLESYLLTAIPRHFKLPLMMEMRGEIWLNRDYMIHRFGRKGMAYSLLYRLIFKYVRNHSTAGLYVNQTLLRRYPIAGRQQQVITDVQLPDEIWGSNRHFDAPARRLLYVGHMEKVKRIDLMLRALQRVGDKLPADWRLDLIGDGPDLPMLSQLAKDLKIHDHVCFEGRLPWGETLFRMYKEADLFLMASTSEGASRALMESMAFGLPAISTKVGSAPDVLNPLALANSGDLEDYSRRLIAIAGNPALMTQLSKENFHRSQDFQYSKLKRERESFFSTAIAGMAL